MDETKLQPQMRQDTAVSVVEKAAEVAARIVADASRAAQDVVATAAKNAATVIRDNDIKNTASLAEALRQVFGEKEEQQRFVDITRIPLICKAIVDMHENLKDIKDKLDNQYITVKDFWVVKSIVYGGASMILVAAMTAFIKLVIIK